MSGFLRVGVISAGGVAQAGLLGGNSEIRLGQRRREGWFEAPQLPQVAGSVPQEYILFSMPRPRTQPIQSELRIQGRCVRRLLALSLNHSSVSRALCWQMGVVHDQPHVVEGRHFPVAMHRGNVQADVALPGNGTGHTRKPGLCGPGLHAREACSSLSSMVLYSDFSDPALAAAHRSGARMIPTLPSHETLPDELRLTVTANK